MARTGLGRGLDVLLGQTAVATRTAPTTVPEIPLERVVPNRAQPRTHFDPESLQQLADSIRQHGLLQPIVVSRAGGDYELVAGQRRVLAARMAGRSTIPAVIREEVGDRLELALVENLQRADLNALETARAYKLLMETYALTQDQLAERVGRSRPHVANILRALQAPQILQDALTAGKISEGHLRALQTLPLSDAIAALGDVLAKELSVREAEALARRMAGGKRHRTGPRPARGSDPETVARTSELRAALGTKVDIHQRRRGGRITIEYYSADDFERLYELLKTAARA